MSNTTTIEPATTMGDFDAIPVIDFAGMLGSDEAAKRRVADEVRSACVNAGFFYIVNHGIPQQAVDAMFDETRRFFDLPLDDKLKLRAKNTEHFCGYVSFREESSDAVNGMGDLHEAYDFATEAKTVGDLTINADYRAVSNQWPDDLPGFRDTMTDYAVSIRVLTRQIFGAFALALDLPENYFDTLTDRPLSLGRLLFYPTQDPKDDQLIGNGPHTDHECFTILCQDKEIQALQVRNKRGEWIDAPPLEGSFVVNIGDLMARWTNDRFASTLHRVANFSGKKRYSIPFFIGANPDAVIEVLPSCVSDDNPAKYGPIVTGDYVLGLISQHLHVEDAK